MLPTISFRISLPPVSWHHIINTIIRLVFKLTLMTLTDILLALAVSILALCSSCSILNSISLYAQDFGIHVVIIFWRYCLSRVPFCFIWWGYESEEAGCKPTRPDSLLPLLSFALPPPCGNLKNIQRCSESLDRRSDYRSWFFFCPLNLLLFTCKCCVLWYIADSEQSRTRQLFYPPVLFSSLFWTLLVCPFHRPTSMR